MCYIYESWLAAREVWTATSVYLNLTSSQGTRRRGVKRWMTHMEIAKQYGDAVAAAIIEHKLGSAERLKLDSTPTAREMRIGVH